MRHILLDLRIDTREDYNVIKVDMSIFNTTKIWTPIFEWYVEGTLQHDCGGGGGRELIWPLNEHKNLHFCNG